MRKITVEVPDKRCAGCFYLIHVPPETAPDDFVCNLFEEDIIGLCPLPSVYCCRPDKTSAYLYGRRNSAAR